MEVLEIRDGQIYINENVKMQLQKYEEEKIKYEFLKKQIVADMEEIQDTIGLQTYDSEQLKISYTKPTQVVTIQKDKLKEEFPEIYEKYHTESERKGSFKIKVNL